MCSGSNKSDRGSIAVQAARLHGACPWIHATGDAAYAAIHSYTTV